MSPDLIVYAVVAAGLIFWLRSILGTRHGDERERPNPLAQAPEARSEAPEMPFIEPGEKLQTNSDQIKELAENPTNILSVENKTAEHGLLEIAAAEKDFDIHFFLEAAQDVFVMVVEGFGKADKETLQNLLAADVYHAFEKAIEQREKDGNVLETEIHAINKVEVVSATLQKKMAYVTLRFIANETRVHKDKEGEIISGHPDRVTTMRDVWTFGKALNSNDPRWLVYETRDDGEDDNEIIPNTEKD